MLGHRGAWSRRCDGALPIQRNVHREGILAVTEVWPGNVPDALAQQAIDAAKAVAQGLNYVGCVVRGIFVVQEGDALSLVVTKSHRVRTIVGTTAKTLVMCRSLNCKCVA